MPPTNVKDALYRFSGMYGSAWRGAQRLGEVWEVSGAIDVQKIEVPLVGTTRHGYKPGRETREGTLRLQLIDNAWEMELWAYLKARNEGSPIPLHQFDLKIQIADPDGASTGGMSWTLRGCQIWRIPLGFSITDDVIDRELPFNWESEEPTTAFSVRTPTGVDFTKPTAIDPLKPTSGLA